MQWNQRSAVSPTMRSGAPSLAAMMASVASSPIFFRMASSPRENSRATYEDEGSPPLRESITSASFFNTDSLILRCPIDQFRILQHRIDHQPGVALQPPVKTTLAPGVTGDPPSLLDSVQHDVTVAIETDLRNSLAMAGLLAL